MGRPSLPSCIWFGIAAGCLDGTGTPSLEQPVGPRARFSGRQGIGFGCDRCLSCTRRGVEPTLAPFARRAHRGHGIRAMQYIAKGSFVVEYTGEVVDAKELEARMFEARREGEQHFYIMDLGAGEGSGLSSSGGD